MLGVDVYYTVKTLLDQGKNISQIAKALSIDIKTVRKIRNNIKEHALSISYSCVKT